ncbi:MAG TPA: hypothetical protein VK968_16750 [Roseimicrobium sp.]|nr:hypothetical protein [Roseimicrobium sp.]
MKTNTLVTTILSLSLSILFVSTAHAADAKKLPEGKPVIKAAPGSQNLNSGPNMEGEITKVVVEGKSFKEALRVKVKKQPTDVWHVQVNNMLTEPVKKGDVVLISFWVRKVEGGGRFNLYFGTPETELEVTTSEELTADKEWKQVQIPATAAASYEAGKGMLNFDTGTGEQILEIADIRLVNYGSKVEESALPKSGL